MKVTTKETQGRFVSVDSYRLCQGSKNYGSNNESNDEKYSGATRKQRLPDNINKNEKNEINNNNRKISLRWCRYEKNYSKALRGVFLCYHNDI